ncbi:MAG TPA: DUF2306 domain-containing protein [Propionibacteriaceae bacterium]|nr:DUF2306 domain-containing protein [Propionibacteriaceae bacterium]
MTYADLRAATADKTNKSSVRWWRRPWIVPLAFLIVAFLTFSLPPYLSLDPSRSRVPAPPDFPLYYPLLVLHVICGSIALGCVVFQIWPWFRNHHRTAHRRIGRTYVLAGVLPGGLAGLILAVNTPFGPVIKVSSVLMALLWLGTTVPGFVMARRGRFVKHRRWMLRSFALTCSIILNRFVAVTVFLVLGPQQQTTFAGNETWFIQVTAGITGWLSWTLTLLLVEWWLERRPYPADRDTRLLVSVSTGNGG